MSPSRNATRSISGIVNECLNEIMEHLLQGNVNSIHIKNVRDMLFNIKQLCDTGNYSPTPPVLKPKRNKVNDGQKKDLYKIAYSLSRFDFHVINDILGTRYNQTQVFDEMEKTTGIKAATLRNNRDRFDPYVKQEASDRKGWHQVELPPELLSVKKEYDRLSREQIIEELRQILSGFKQKSGRKLL